MSCKAILFPYFAARSLNDNINVVVFSLANFLLCDNDLPGNGQRKMIGKIDDFVLETVSLFD